MKCRNEDFSEKIYENNGLKRLFQDEKYINTNYFNDIFINILTDTRIYNNGFVHNFADFLNKYFVSFDGKPLNFIESHISMSSKNPKRKGEPLIKKKCCSCCNTKRGSTIANELTTILSKENFKIRKNLVFYHNLYTCGKVDLLLPEQRFVIHCSNVLPSDEEHRLSQDFALMRAGYNVINDEGNTYFICDPDNNTIKAIIDILKNW